MKSYSIGREETCNIIVSDPTQMVSRRHATLNVDGRRMTIVDSSTNGTYINGIRIQSGTPVPVTRKDVVSFAQVAELDWKCVPKEGNANLIVALAVCVLVLLGGGSAWYFINRDKEEKGKVKETEAAAWSSLGARIDTLSKAVPAIKDKLKAVNCELDTLKKSMDKKDAAGKKNAASLDQAKQTIWSIERAIHGINPDELQKSLDVVMQSYKDKVEATETRVADLEKKVKDNQEALKEADKLLAKAKEIVNGIPNKMVQKQTDNNKSEQKGTKRRLINS